MRTLMVIAALTASPVLAESHLPPGDAEAGADAFSQCQTCHIIQDEEGNVLAGKRARTGPNLFGVMGRQAGTVEGFRYGKSLVATGEAGLVWDRETMIAYLQNPQEFLRETLDDKKARSKMSYRVRKEDVAADLTAFLETFSDSEKSTVEAKN